jgi:hypothetical protein
VSYDLNYRKKLWTPAEARKIKAYDVDVDILITTEEIRGCLRDSGEGL